MAAGGREQVEDVMADAQEEEMLRQQIAAMQQYHQAAVQHQVSHSPLILHAMCWWVVVRLVSAFHLSDECFARTLADWTERQLMGWSGIIVN